MADLETSRDPSNRVQITVALIGLTGVIATAVISNWNHIFPRKTIVTAPPAAVASTTAVTPKKSVRPVHSNGHLLVRGTFMYDLDSGTESTTGADFWWEQATSTKRFLTPKNGATFFVVGIKEFETVKFSDMERYPYSAEKIDGSDNADNKMPRGTVIAYKTKKGRLGKLIVDDYGYNLTIRWRTFD